MKKVKITYQLMTKGIRTKTKIAGKIYNLKEPWHVPYYSTPKYVIDATEEYAMNQIRKKLKNKWLGFKVLKVEVF